MFSLSSAPLQLLHLDGSLILIIILFYYNIMSCYKDIYDYWMMVIFLYYFVNILWYHLSSTKIFLKFFLSLLLPMYYTIYIYKFYIIYHLSYTYTRTPGTLPNEWDSNAQSLGLQ